MIICCSLVPQLSSKLSHRRPYLCEFDEGRSALAKFYISPNIKSLWNNFEVSGIYKGPATSYSSCLAFCQGKGTKTAFFKKVMCVCFKGKPK